jgi:S1-C subfamily serine protease
MSGKRGIIFAAALAAAALGAADAVAAPEWAISGQTDSMIYETDLTSVAQQGALVRSVVRMTLARPERDRASGKMYQVELTERFDDCVRHRWQVSSFVRTDTNGTVVRSGSGLSAGWDELQPGTVGESVSRTACAVAAPPKEPPIQADLRDGSWTDLGLSADGKYRLEVRMDVVKKMGNGPVITVTRRVYPHPEWIDGFAIKYVVSGTAVDCASGKSAGLQADFFLSPTARVRSMVTPEDKVKFEPAPPSSFLAKSLQLICAAATPMESERHGGGMSVGTAWGVNKGYLVTASHVIGEGGKILVYSNGEKVGTARLVADDPANDLAILKFTPSKPGKIAILPIAAKTATLGRNIFTLGYPEPDALGQHVKMTAGQVSSTAGYQDDARYLQISAPIQQGNSGGPVIAWDGSVVGVVEAKLTRFGEDKEKLAPEMVNYALKASYVRPMLEDLPDLANYTIVKASGNNDQLIEAARKAVFMVVVVPPEARR